MQLKTILNRVERYKSFVYGELDRRAFGVRPLDLKLTVGHEAFKRRSVRFDHIRKASVG
jgi:hypothetical protein